jgi:hypothetical protein
MEELKNLICTAIENRQRIQFEYHDKVRIAEPQCCGISTAGKEVLRAYLLHGGSRPEQLFELGKMKSFHLLEEHFAKPGPNYKKDDSAMKPGSILCQL